MTSWGTKPMILRLSADKLYCKTSTSGYGSNFFNFFMCYLFAQSKKRVLFLHDTKNNLSKDYHFIFDTLKPLPGIDYTLLQGFTIQQLYGAELHRFYQGLSKEYLREQATRIFQWNERTQKEIDTFKKNLPFFDCGVHVRTGDKITTGEMKAIPFEEYRKTLKDFQELSRKKMITIYLMTDSEEVIQFFHKTKDPSWTILSVPSPTRFQGGHDQTIYNKQPREKLFQSFYHFLAELQILQECPYVVCTFSSNIGRLLDLTNKGTIVSLD